MLKRYYVWPWNTLTVINLRSCLLRQKQWWNFLGKISLSARQKYLLTYVNLWLFERSRYFFLRQKQNSPITSHAMPSVYYFFFVLSVSISKPPRMMSHSANCCHRKMSSSANYRPFLSSFRHIPPQEHFVKLANKLFKPNVKFGKGR